MAYLLKNELFISFCVAVPRHSASHGAGTRRGNLRSQPVLNQLKAFRDQEVGFEKVSSASGIHLTAAFH